MNDFQKRVLQYAIILSSLYLLQTVWSYFGFKLLNEKIMENPQGMYLFQLIPIFVRYVFNAVIAFMAYSDLKKHMIKSPLTIIITFFFGFIGVGILFIQILYKLNQEKAST